jgi:hypothetical protein
MRGRLGQVIAPICGLTRLTCTPVPHYSVAAQSVEDIQEAIKFAYEKDLYLVVKDTGHSQ